MQFKTNFTPANLKPQVQHAHRLLLLGSCFTEHISKRMLAAKMHVMQNPSGILFNPMSVANCLNDIISNKQYKVSDVFNINEAWQSWHIHSNLGDADLQTTLQNINEPISSANDFVQNVDWVIITLGSAFAYWHNTQEIYVSNNHRAPLDLFTKKLLEVSEITEAMQTQIDALKKINPAVQILFTISPVRHLRDGLVDNNRSKARLIEATHALVAANANAQYFAAYEIVIDELRDYRFYDIDFAHPNFMATEYVWQQFLASSVATADHALLTELTDINIALNHKPFNATSKAHKAFLARYAEKCVALKAQHAYLNLANEISYFNATS
jgi:hypothetical protein